MKDNIKTITIKFIGYGIILASFLYIFFLLRNIEYSKFQDSLKDFILIKFCIFTFICAFSNFILAFAWRYILELLHQKDLPFRSTFKIYMKAFIARYIPGNIFHFVSRQFMGTKLGISHTTLALSSVLESFLLLVVGCIFIFTGFALNFFNISVLGYLSISSKKLFFLFAGGCVCILVYIIYNKRFKEIFGVFSIQKTGHLIRLWIYYSIFLLINGIVLFCIFSFMFESDLKIGSLPVIVCANVVAWMGGFITPGASGGIGVRAVLLTMLLSNMLPTAIIVGGVVIFRMITLFGEVLALCIAICSPLKENEQNK